MALGAAYATLDQLKTHLRITDTSDDTELTRVAGAASREVDKYCHRQFNTTGTTASARLFYPDGRHLLEVDEIASTTDLAVTTDEGDDGTYETTWAASDYQLEPLNGVVDGETGWPYTRLRAVGSRTWPLVAVHTRAPVRITARWGWPAVPAAVVEATLLIAAETFKLRDAPFGVAGFGEFGVVRIRANPVVARLLNPYVRNPVQVG